MCTATVCLLPVLDPLLWEKKVHTLPFLTPSALSPLTINAVREWGLKTKSLESGVMSHGTHFLGKLYSWELAWGGKVRMLGHPQRKIAVWNAGD